MEFTQQYQLNQWAAGDRILREEFNRDNQRLESGLTGLAAAVRQEQTDRAAAVQSARSDAAAAVNGAKQEAAAAVAAEKTAREQAVAAVTGQLPRFHAGTYTGDGNRSRTLTFPFVPKVVIIVADKANASYCGTVLLQGQTGSNGMGANAVSAANYMQWTVSWSGTSVSWTSGSHVAAAMNTATDVYRYLVIG